MQQEKQKPHNTMWGIELFQTCLVEGDEKGSSMETIKGKKQALSRERPQTVCVRSVRGKSRDLDALGSREVMVVMK